VPWWLAKSLYFRSGLTNRDGITMFLISPLRLKDQPRGAFIMLCGICRASCSVQGKLLMGSLLFIKTFLWPAQVFGLGASPMPKDDRITENGPSRGGRIRRRFPSLHPVLCRTLSTLQPGCSMDESSSKQPRCFCLPPIAGSEG
jgi:hypothetical protein